MDIVSEQAVVTRFESLPQPELRVVVSGNFAMPVRLMGLFDAAVASYRLFMLNAQHAVPERDGVVYESPFVGPAMRGHPRLDYLPMRLSLVPRLFAVARAPDVVLLHTSPPRSGKVSLGIEVNILPAAIEHAHANGGLVVAQCNPRMPYTYGDAEIDLDAIDLAIEVEETLPVPARRPAGDTTMAIAEGVVSLVSDGATLQAGVGEVPDAVIGLLQSRRGLRVWTEAMGDGVLALERCGALEPGAQITATFLFGSEELYDWADGNELVRMLRTETVNDPTAIASHDLMCSLNAALQVDLWAQANASYVRGEIYSGFGGQPDFVVGALHSRGGQAIIALPSRHGPTGTSTIVGMLDAPATSFQHSAIITEQGCARIFGRSQRAQARLLIEEAAHPDARAALREVSRGAGRPA
ncbi:MAG: acetyl-CoA hydrolase/transferase C-terminal domain-containing protein [Acidimicrobiales bacterium]